MWSAVARPPQPPAPHAAAQHLHHCTAAEIDYHSCAVHTCSVCTRDRGLRVRVKIMGSIIIRTD
eukprot:COSAG01_NODE_389_length_17708_cov_111.404452_20_plen_64_part_00